MAPAPAAPPPREPAWDVARGVAVVTMVWVHFVPEPDPIDGALAAALAASVRGLDGLPAALFLLLVGAGVHLGAPHAPGGVARRALALLAVGLPFWWFVWPNDILVPIALATVAVAWLDRLGPRALVAAIVLLCALVPPALLLGGDYVWYVDLRDDGTHEANHSFGWHTLRWFAFDGAYPLLPWLVFPLLGALLARTRGAPRARTRWLIAGALAALAAYTIDRAWGDAWADGARAHLAVTWQPTSLPFVMLWGGAAVVVAAGSLRLASAGRLRRATAPLAAVGRASLSHYLLHTAGVYAAMRLWWPDEGWSAGVGVAVAAAYLAFAFVVAAASSRWAQRGPLERLLRAAAGR